MAALSSPPLACWVNPISIKGSRLFPAHYYSFPTPQIFKPSYGPGLGAVSWFQVRKEDLLLQVKPRIKRLKKNLHSGRKGGKPYNWLKITTNYRFPKEVGTRGGYPHYPLGLMDRKRFFIWIWFSGVSTPHFSSTWKFSGGAHPSLFINLKVFRRCPPLTFQLHSMTPKKSERVPWI